MDEANYIKRVASPCIDMVIDAPFLTDPALCEEEEGPVRRFFGRILDVSTVKKGHLLVDLTARFVVVWQQVGQAEEAAAPAAMPSAVCFVAEVVQLLTMREQDASLQHRADEEACEEGGVAATSSGPPLVR